VEQQEHGGNQGACRRGRGEMETAMG
jgi:hypothetical protein